MGLGIKGMGLQRDGLMRLLDDVLLMGVINNAKFVQVVTADESLPEDEQLLAELKGRHELTKAFRLMRDVQSLMGLGMPRNEAITTAEVILQQRITTAAARVV